MAFFSLLGGVVNNVDRAVNDPDVQEAVGGAIDAGVRTVGMGVELASAGASRVAEGVDVVSKVAADPVGCLLIQFIGVFLDAGFLDLFDPLSHVRRIT